MIDVITLIMVILMAIGLLIMNVYILLYFSHPDDKGNTLGYVLKAIVILGLTLSWCQVLLLPLDVSNNRTFGGGLNMKIFWYIIIGASIIYIIIIFPISKALYEADDDWSCCDKIKHSLCCFLVALIFYVGITVVLYISIGKAQISVKRIICDYKIMSQKSDIEILNFNGSCNTFSKNLEIKVNILIYATGIMTFISWVAFALFGGIGLAAVPLDFFYSFLTRPKSINSCDMDKRRIELISELEDLKILGSEVSDLEKRGANKKFFFSRDRRNYNRKINEFRARYTLDKEEFHIVNASNEIIKKNNCVVVCYYLLLPIAIITSIISLLWVIQFICSYFYIKNGRPGYPFLAYLFIFFQDHSIAFLSFAFFAIFCLYLLFCTIKGNFKFGVRILCCWSIYPMKKEETYMNAFLFNISLVLLSSFAITQYCSDCFSDYVVFTDIDSLSNVLIKNLIFFKYFYRYHIFQYIYFVIFVISFVYLIRRPVDKPRNLYEKNEKLKEIEMAKKDKAEIEMLKNKKKKKEDEITNDISFNNSEPKK